ncbi:MAG: extracellular solute-binding protein [Hyphomicrobiaceae bacterium]|nr:extracellular solute-binding protein [Hyphomicrobiaceae bacterium]
MAFSLHTTGARAEARHAIAMHGEPKLAAGFAHFPYADPQAPKGGRVTLGAQGTFDNLNPYTIRGLAPPYLREHVFESLLARSNDEPFTLYGWIAESIEVPDDRSSITFHLNPKARFSDGAPVTADDVLFTHALLKAKGWPYHRAHYAKVAAAEKLGPHTVRFAFAPARDAGGAEVFDREMPLILGLLPVLPRHRLDPETFEQTTLEPPVGSGPYTVTAVEPGRTLTYKRNPAWWARDLPAMRGRFNFDEVRLEYYRDASSLFEAFKSGDIDLRPEDDPGRWIDGYGFPAANDGRVVKSELATAMPSGMTALAMNARRPQFADQRVRRAFILMLDAEWIDRSLYNGAFKRTQSFFDRSSLSSAGRPADDLERRLLAPFLPLVKPEVLDGTYRLPETSGSGDDRANLQAAFRLLQEAGWTSRNGRISKDGTPLTVELLAANRPQERLMLAYARNLERIGIKASIRLVDSAQYFARLKVYDFDMIQWNWSASLSPGNEQINRWSSRAAAIEGSLNYAAVANAAADAMIEAMLNARGEAEFVSAVRAFDRVLLSGDYVVPLFHLPRVWIGHWAHLKHPARLSLAGFDLDTWWSERR